MECLKKVWKIKHNVERLFYSRGNFSVGDLGVNIEIEHDIRCAGYIAVINYYVSDKKPITDYTTIDVDGNSTFTIPQGAICQDGVHKLEIAVMDMPQTKYITTPIFALYSVAPSAVSTSDMKCEIKGHIWDMIVRLEDAINTGDLENFVMKTLTINGHTLEAPVNLSAQDVKALPDTYKPHWDDIEGTPSEFPPEDHIHGNATTSEDGFMSSVDKTKLNEIVNEVQFGGRINTGNLPDVTQISKNIIWEAADSGTVTVDGTDYYAKAGSWMLWFGEEAAPHFVVRYAFSEFEEGRIDALELTMTSDLTLIGQLKASDGMPTEDPAKGNQYWYIEEGGELQIPGVGIAQTEPLDRLLWYKDSATWGFIPFPRGGGDMDDYVKKTFTINGYTLENPFSINAGDVGAYSKQEIDDMLAEKADLTGADFTGAITSTVNITAFLGSHNIDPVSVKLELYRLSSARDQAIENKDEEVINFLDDNIRKRKILLEAVKGGKS